jgi:Flp pilus assembly protein TadD
VLLERGRFAEAVAACQKLADLKPGLEAYSRVAHLRWLHGDIEGAIAAMEQAVSAGTNSNPEPQAWSLARLSYFYLQQGRFVEAHAAARKATTLVDDYPPALLALGKAGLAAGNIYEAEFCLAHAAHLNPIPEYQWWHADSLEAAGRDREANELREELRQTGASNDPRTFAVFLATTGDQASEALFLARSEVEQRPDPFSWDALAWAQLAAGNSSAAGQSMQRALSFKTRDARLFLHAAIIAQHLNKEEDAARYFNEARPLAATLTPLERTLLEASDHSTRSAVSPRETVSTKQPKQNETNNRS